MISKSISVPRSRADAPVSKRLRSYNINKELGSSFCAICSLIDNTKNLCAAGTFHATKGKVNISHNDKLTVFFRKMAATVGNEFLLKTVVFADLAANEIFDNRKCYKDLVRQYNKLISEREFDTNDNN